MKDRIIIEKDLIPYTFNILLADNWFQVEVKYNTYADMFTIGLYRDNECLVAGEPLVYGKPLFADYYTPDFPALNIIPVDEAGNNNTVTWDNFGETVFLSVYDDNDDTITYSGEITAYSEPTAIDSGLEVITAEQLVEMENAITLKGGVVKKINTIPTFDELINGINSIPTGGIISGKMIISALVDEGIIGIPQEVT